METTEEYKDRIIALGDTLKEFVTDVDGFVYYWPDGSTHGHMASHHLRWIADELDQRNEPHQKQIDDYFGEISQNNPYEPFDLCLTCGKSSPNSGMGRICEIGHSGFNQVKCGCCERLCGLEVDDPYCGATVICPDCMDKRRK